MAVELASAYVSIIPSARGIEANLARELAPVSGIASKQGEVAGAALGGSFVQKFAGKTGNLLQGLDRQLGSFGGPFTGNLTTIGTSLRAVESGQLKVAAGASDFERVATGAYVGVGLAAAGFGAISIKSALGAEQAEAQLEQAFKATGNSIDDYGSQLDGARKKLAGFGFDQEQVNASLATLVRATKDPAKAIKDIALAADTARARNEDLATSTQRLVNVEAGRIRGLTQLGISTKDANGKTITSEEAIQRITALYGGSAAANAKTYEGELQALGATAHNLEESLGSALLPAVANLGNELVAGVHGLEAINSATHGWLGSLAGAAFVAGGVAVAVSKIGSGVSKLVDLLTASTAATEAGATADTTAASAAAARAASVSTLVDLEQAEVAASLELSTAEETLAAALDSVSIAGAEVVATDAEIAAASATVTAAQAAQAEAASALAAAEAEGAAASGLFAGGLAAIVGPAAALAGGFLLGKKAGDELNDVLAGAKPNADELAASLRELAKTGDLSSLGGGPIDLGRLSGDLTTIKGNTFQKAFGLAPSAHRAVQDIGAENDALASVLQTGGVDKATKAYGLLTQGLEAQGVSLGTISSEFSPFLDKLDAAAAKERDAKGATDSLSISFSDLAGGFAKDTAKLGLADQLQSAKDAIKDLDQTRLDAAGKGDKFKQAAYQEAQAQQSLTDAYRSQSTAATSLADAKSKLAQFDSPTDSRIRSLELQNIQGRVVTTPEEARQKEIDLLSFSEDTANKRADLQKQVTSAENGVQSATEGVTRAQHDVSVAAKARQKVQTDAAAAIAGAERKATEAIDAAGTAIDKAKIAGQLGKGNTQLDIYVGLLDQLAKRVDPDSPLSKNLEAFLGKAILLDRAHAGDFAHGPTPFGPQPVDFSHGPTPYGPQPALVPSTSKPVVINTTNHFHGNDQPTTSSLDHLNKKQAIRLRVSGIR